MLLDIFTKGSTDRSVVLRCLDATTGAPKTDVVFNSAGIDMWYRREGAARTAVTEVTLAALTTAHTDGGFLHEGDGYYRFDLPDAAFATGANYVNVGGAVTGGYFIGGRVKLVDVNLEDAVRGGMTALPNAAAAASGGLPILGTNATAISFTAGMTISNASGSGLTLSSGGSNGSGLNAAGNGSGHGILATGGATGHGVNGVGGATSGSGLRGVGSAGNSAGVAAVGQGSAAGLQATGGATGAGIGATGGATSGAGVAATSTSGNGVTATGGTAGHGLAATGGATGNGINGIGGATSGVGIRGAAAGGNSVGIAGFGQGSAPGIQGTGGATGAGVNAVGGGTSGAGLLVTATSGNGATITGGGTGNGIVATSGAGATGDGIQATAASTNGSGVRFTKTGTGVALGATTTDIVLAKTTNITGYTDLDAAGVRTAVGMASANLDTQLGAIDAVTDKLDTALELDGAVYRYTVNALELAPTGGSAPTASAIADEVQTRTIAAVTTVNGLAANVITAASLDADAGAEIGTAVWATAARTLTAIDEDSTTLDLDATIRAAVGLGSANLDTQLGDLPTNAELATALGTSDDAVLAAVATAQGDITSINGRLPSDPADASVVAGLIGGLDTKLDNIDGNVDAILLDTGTDGVVVAAASKTGYRLSSTGVDDVLRTPLNEGYAAQGAEFTLEQVVYMLWALAAERAVAGTTLTASQIDGATPAMTFTLDDATTPTEQTRAT